MKESVGWRRRGLLRALAGGLTVVSGVLMMLSGIVGRTRGWSNAGLFSLAGGPVILGAFAFARMSVGADARSKASGSRPSAQIRRSAVGMIPILPPAAMAATLLAGGVMVLAGYAGAAWAWGLTIPLALLAVLVIAVAFALDSRRSH